MSGNLTKKGKSSSRYTRFWCTLRNDVFAYYTSATDMYFPSGTIDLRYAIKAEHHPNNPDGTASSSFNLITEKRTFVFKADSPVSASNWVKSLQKEIFRSRNEGDQVVIKIPVENILDLEESLLFDIVDALKIKAIDSDETYAIDEYVLAFLTMDGQDEQGFQVPAEAIRKVMEQHGLSEIDNDDIEKISESRKVIGHVMDSTYAGGSPPNGSPTGTPRPSSPTLESVPNSARRKGTIRRKVKRIGTLVSSSKDALSSRPDSAVQSSANLVTHSAVNLATQSNINIATHSTSNLASGDPKLSESTDSFYDVGEKLSEIDLALMDERKKKKGGAASSVVNKFSELWSGGTKHFEAHHHHRHDKFLVSKEDRHDSTDRFRSHFSLGDSEELVASYYTHIQKAIPIYGKIYVSHNYVCFRSVLPGTRTKMILPIRDIENVAKERGFRFGYSGLVIVIHGHEEIFFEFGLGLNRDDCVNVILHQLDLMHSRKASIVHVEDEEDTLRHARLFTFEDALYTQTDQARVDAHKKAMEANLEDNYTKHKIGTKVVQPLRYTLLTIGSRGDVQPYIALAKGLMKEGHSVKIASHSEFREWVEGHGIEYAEIAGDPGELMKIMIEHGMFSVSFLRDAASKFRSWIDELLQTAWEACQGTDVLIEAPSAMAGIHIAEALRIPYFRSFTMPWSRTRAYPHAFIVPEQKMGGSYNYLTYVLFDNVFWKGISGQVNKWRKETLGLRKTNLDLMAQTKVPFLYSVSPAILVPPVDFSDWIKVTGYWFLDEGNGDYKPPEDLAAFIKKARDDNKKIVYIGFGSIVVSDSREMTQAVIDSVIKAGVRCILSKGWSDRDSEKKGTVTEVDVPAEHIFQIKSAPHDWLFPQMDAAVHHGGSGTTGASLRAGIPTIIKPFFGDQFFYAGRVEDLGAGIFLKKLNVKEFSKALIEATTSHKMMSKAQVIGKQIRSENGVNKAIETIYLEMRYARSLIKPAPTKEGKSMLGKVLQRTGSFVSGGGSRPGSPTGNSSGRNSSDEKTDDSWMLVDGAAPSSGSTGDDMGDKELEGIKKKMLESFNAGPSKRLDPM